MPLDFPTSPTDGQTYNGYVYSTSVGAWQAKPAAQSPFYTRDTPPSNPVVGDSWFNTNDGTMYIYTYDGNTYQWVEHRSQIARSQVGLVPIVPTSVNISGGTATIAASGNVVFTAGTTGITLNGVFSSAYNNYRIIFSGNKNAVAGNDFVYLRLTASGVETTTNYNQAVAAFNMSNATIQNLGGTGATGFGGGRIYQASSYFDTTIDIYSPFIVSHTHHTGLSYGTTLGEEQHIVTGGRNYNNASYDGIKLLTTGNTMNGEISVYGYNK